MNCEYYKIPGVVLFQDENNFSNNFFEKIYDYNLFAKEGLKTVFSQHFEMKFLKPNTLRGFYIQDAPWSQNQMFHCVSGSCKVVLLDLREKQPTFQQYVSIILESEKAFLYFPAGVAYAVLALEENTVLYGFADNLISTATNIVINAVDGDVKNEWPSSDLIVSARDRMAMKVSELPHNYW